MNTQIKQIASRLLGLREALELNMSQASALCGVSEADYALFESGESDIPMSFICIAAQAFGVDTSSLITGAEPNPVAYFVTRKGSGPGVERTSCYAYQSLANGFPYPKAEPFEVTVSPGQQSFHLNSHPGQEFNLVLEGSMQLQIGGNVVELSQGDSIYFDATQAHGMMAMNNQSVRFLAVIV